MDTPYDALWDILVLEAIFDRIYNKFRLAVSQDGDPTDEVIKISSNPDSSYALRQAPRDAV